MIGNLDMLLMASEGTYLLLSQKIRDAASSAVPRHLRLELHCDLQNGAEPIHPSVEHTDNIYIYVTQYTNTHVSVRTTVLSNIITPDLELAPTLTGPHCACMAS